MSAPVEAKVYGATLGGGAGAVVSNVILWGLGVGVWNASSSADAATLAVAAVPAPIVGLIGLLITVGGAFFGGWLAKHTPRPDPASDAPVDELPEDLAVEDAPAEEPPPVVEVPVDETNDAVPENPAG